ncbi:MAG: cupin domain-containing protein [Rhodopseudomonas sp.]|nr:cupin domain-containing protein [Rhodopseudomonas sp.]
MAIHFNESTIAPIVTADGVTRQPLLNRQRIPSILFDLDRLTIPSGGEIVLSISPGELGWFQMIDGSATLRADGDRMALTASHIGLLPPGFSGRLASDAGATLLLARVPDAARLDPTIDTAPPPFRIVDWQNEPLLQSEHDARKRIYLVTPKMFGTRAIRGEMIIYPPRTECPRHHHNGGAHFMYFLTGQGTCYAGKDQVMAVKPGDIVYYDDLEPHWVQGGTNGDMIFSEFFVPSAVQTIWDDPSQVCTWLPTGINHRGGSPSRVIEKHAHSHLADV